MLSFQLNINYCEVVCFLRSSRSNDSHFYYLFGLSMDEKHFQFVISGLLRVSLMV